MSYERRFEWNDAKAQGNLAKHGVPFAYASRVFLDLDVVDFDASKPDDGEVRREAVGLIDGRLFVVVYTPREEVVRIISARRCNAAEARRYGPLHT